MGLSLVFAIGPYGVFGYKGNLPFKRSKSDMAQFRKLTMRKVVIMGRETWESLPEKHRPLKGRFNVVLTRDNSYQADGAVTFASLREAVDEFPNAAVIGGSEILYECMNLKCPDGKRSLFDMVSEANVSIFPFNMLKEEVKKELREVLDDLVSSDEFVGPCRDGIVEDDNYGLPSVFSFDKGFKMSEKSVNRELRRSGFSNTHDMVFLNMEIMTTFFNSGSIVGVTAGPDHTHIRWVSSSRF